MKFEREEPKASFEIPDRPTVRQQLLYMGKSNGVYDGTYPLRFWDGAKTLITEWKCEVMPDMNADIDKLDSPSVTNVLIWAGLQVWSYMQKLEDVPKN